MSLVKTESTKQKCYEETPKGHISGIRKIISKIKSEGEERILSKGSDRHVDKCKSILGFSNLWCFKINIRK